MGNSDLSTGFLCHELYMWHETGPYAGLVPPGLDVEPGQNCESPESKRRIRNLLEVSGLLEQLASIKPVPAGIDDLARFHTHEYIDRIRKMSADDGGDGGEFSPFGRGSFDIGLLSAGGTIQMMEAVLAGKVQNGYALVRPPGHHAETDIGRGYCLFGNIAIAIMKAQAVHHVGRVAVVDWDVHHGNGTQQAFYDSDRTLTISIHQDRLYPFESGSIEENGQGAGEGYNLNVPLPPGSGVGAYGAAFDKVVIPALERFRPEMIFVASGFDAGGHDPLGRMMMHSDGYRSLTGKLMDTAIELCEGRLVFSHEGGYNPYHVPYCGLAVLEELSGISTHIEDPWMPLMQDWGQQGLQPHQEATIARAAALVEKIR